MKHSDKIVWNDFKHPKGGPKRGEYQEDTNSWYHRGIDNSLSKLSKPFMPGGNSELVPPDPIPNSEVKRLSADDSVGVPM